MKEIIAWCVISKTNPIVTSEQLPIYYSKKVAKIAANLHGGKVVKVIIKEVQP